MKHVQARTYPLRTLLACIAGAAALSCSAGESAPVAGSAALLEAENAMRAGDCQTALPAFETALRDITVADLAERATEAAFECGQSARAARLAEVWRQRAPENSRAALASVRASLVQYRLEEARAAMLAWLRGTPGPDESALSGAVQHLADNAGAGPTLELLRRVRHPLFDHAMVRQRMAMLAFDGADYQYCLQQALASRPEQESRTDARGLLYVLMARAAAGLGREAEAMRYAKLASDLRSTLADTRAEALIMLGQVSEGRAELARLALEPAIAERIERRLAQLAIFEGNYGDAVERLGRLLRRQSSAPFAVYQLGLIAERATDNDAALQRYELLAGSSYDVPARQRVAGIYFRDGERAQAAQMLAPREDDSVAARIGALIAIADLYSEHGAYEEALQRIARALESYPAHPDLVYQQSVIHARALKSDAAIEVLDAIYTQRPGDPTIANALGYTLADFKRELPRAEALIRAALKAQPDNPAIIDSMGWVLYRRGKLKESLPWFERAWRLLQEGDIGAHWGEVLWQLGRQDEARAVWQRALIADPEDGLLLDTAKRFAVELKPARPAPMLVSGESTRT